MKTTIILHGMPSKEEYFNSDSPTQSNKHWIPWVQKQLILKNILAQTPEMPEPYEPDYKKWSLVFEQFKIDEETILVGHSCGAGFLVRWLSENNIKVGKVVLVAPWLNPNNEYELKNNFFDFEIDKNLTSKTKDVTVFYSTDDEKYIIDSVDILKSKIEGIIFEKFTNKGHFTFGDMKTEEFPELIDTLLK